MTAPVEALSPEQQQQLIALEATIQDGLREFQRTGSALAEIRDQRLYRATYATFDEYLAERWHFTRQHAGRLIQAAEVTQILEPVGYMPENEHQARQARDAARIVQDLAPEQQQQVAQFLRATTGSEKPSTSQIKAVAEVVQAIDASGTVEHPDTGEQVPFTALPEPARMAVIRENVSTGTHERMKRQEQHIQDSVQAKNSTGKGSWTDWCMNYAAQHLTDDQELRIVVRRDASGNPKAQALVIDTVTHQTVAYGDPADWLKAAVMSLVEEVKGA